MLQLNSKDLMREVRKPLSGETSVVVAASTAGVTYALIASLTKTGTKGRLFASIGTAVVGYGVTRSQQRARRVHSAAAAVGVGMMVGGSAMAARTLITNPELTGLRDQTW